MVRVTDAEAMSARSDDVTRDTRFYQDLFGRTSEVMEMPGFMDTTCKRDGAFVAGMMQRSPEWEGVTPCWCTYFTVDDVDKAATDAPGVGRFCGITSPQGVGFCVMQYDR